MFKLPATKTVDSSKRRLKTQNRTFFIYSILYPSRCHVPLRRKLHKYPFSLIYSVLRPMAQTTNEKGRGEIGRVSALSAGAYTTTLCVMVDIVKGGGRAPTTLTRLG